MIKPSFIIKGMLTFVLPSWAYSRKSGGSSSARYCYSVFMRHVVKLNGETGFTVPETVAELGPGDSLGMGLCALLTGAERYIGLDVVRFADLSGNLGVLDELVELFRSRAPIPDDREFPRIKPKLDDYAFPASLFDDAMLEKNLDPQRLEHLRESLSGQREGMIEYAAPWTSDDRIDRQGVDWIFSQAVLEHVDDLDGAYAAFSAWLSADGLMSHQIDFKSHNMATVWNGHWATGDALWALVRGRRPYLLNREPLPTHLTQMVKHGFEPVAIERVLQDDGLRRDQLPPRFQNLPDEDLRTSGAFVIARKLSR